MIARLKDLLPAMGAAFGVAAGLWYGLLSLLCEIVYEPVGVQPREVGLSSGGVLAQAGSGFAAFFLGTVLYFGTGWAILFYRRRRSTQQRAGSASFPAPALLWTYAVIAVVGAFVPLVISGIEGRHQLRDGETPEAPLFFVTVPWEASIAEPHWAMGKVSPITLPSCVLYLGQADATVVLYYVTGASKNRTGETLRLPAASVVLKLEPGKHKCPDKGADHNTASHLPISPSPVPAPARTDRVPILRGRTLSEARGLVKRHFKLGTATHVAGSGVAVGRILSASPPGGTLQKVGTVISVRIRKRVKNPGPCSKDLCTQGNA